MGAGPPLTLSRGGGQSPLSVSAAAVASMAAPSGEQIYREVQDYYGKELQKSEDLQTNACVTLARPLPTFIKEALKCVHDDVVSRYYGCGLVIPECLETCWILDLGSGSGRDCYMLSKLVGEKGHVTGIDMTDTQVEVAKKHIDYHMKKFGYQVPNVDFIHGYVEKLGDAGLKDESYDIVISNCVINLSPDKRAVLQEAYRVLKGITEVKSLTESKKRLDVYMNDERRSQPLTDEQAGGEMYFSDVYASGDLPEDIRKHRVLWGECLGGALWWKDLYRIAEEVGFCPPRLVTASQITINNKELESVVGDCQFVSATFRLFKVPKKGPAERCQVIYNGGITGHEKELEFDANFTFKEGEVVEVDAETAAILQSSRFAEEFLIRLAAGRAPGGCCPAKVKEKIVDPFQLVEHLEAKDLAPKPAGCCGPKGCC